MKKILCFFAGYTLDFNKSDNEMYGSEIALKNIAERLTKKYEVYIFGDNLEKNKVNNVNYKNANELKEFSKKNNIEIMIIHRYLYYFLEFEFNIAKKTFLWIHDFGPHHAWQHKFLPNEGKSLLKNNLNHINKIIVLTKWHKKTIQKNYDLPEKKLEVIGNGIQKIPKKIKKKEDLFIWFQSPERGLIQTIQNFYRIKKIIPNAKLKIYGDKEYLIKNNISIDELQKQDIFHFGKLPHNDLQKHMVEAKYWIYTTNSHETYCMSALEAQAAELLCIATNSTGLADTLGNGKRGILLNQTVYSDKYWEELELKLNQLKNNEQLQKNILKEGLEFAKKQTWDNKVKEWINLFKVH